MMIFTTNVEDKLKKIEKLGITERTVAEILRNTDELLYDALRNRFVAISWNHNTAVIYGKSDDDLVIVTVMYSGGLKDAVNRRKRVGRWT
jgi:hypothetical protein